MKRDSQVLRRPTSRELQLQSILEQTKVCTMEVKIGTDSYVESLCRIITGNSKVLEY